MILLSLYLIVGYALAFLAARNYEIEWRGYSWLEIDASILPFFIGLVMFGLPYIIFGMMRNGDHREFMVELFWPKPDPDHAMK